MYKIVGADQKEYGPVTEEQIKQWAQEGRANGQTLVRFGEGPWRPLSTFPELASSLPPQPMQPPPVANYGAYPAYSNEPKTNALAKAGLIFGVLGLLCCTPFAAVGLVLSCVGYYQIQQNPQMHSGKSIALAGIITSALGLILFVVLIMSGAFEELLKNMPKV